MWEHLEGSAHAGIFPHGQREDALSLPHCLDIHLEMH
jgi:hypothetical protein